MAYRRYHKMDVRIVRIFNTYGPRMRPNDGRVVSNFIVQALQRKPLTVYGDDLRREVSVSFQTLSAESWRCYRHRRPRKLQHR